MIRLLLTIGILSLALTVQSQSGMIDLRTIPTVIFDIRYASSNNFTGQQIYPKAGAYMVKPAAEALENVVADLNERGLSIKVFDAYRPLSAQKKLWEMKPDPTFVADSKTGSRHNRGAAIDLTLINLKGKTLPMPTDYDEFVEAAAHSYTNLPDTVLENRSILKETMEQHGFVSLDSEWWHYDYQGWKEYPVLDLDFDEIKN